MNDECFECGLLREDTDEEWRLFNDLRDPPLDTEPCLCKDCYINIINECIDDYEQAILELNALKEKLLEEQAQH